MHHSITRLSHLVSQLLKLSRLGNPLVKHHFSTVDLASLCQQAVAENQNKAEARSQTLENCCQPVSEIQASPELTLSLVNNLIDNAIKYSGHGSHIRLGCENKDAGIALTVEDSGPGLSEQQQVAVLERFARADANDKQGAGLGLSIVKSISDAHDAELLLSRSQTLGGLAVTVQFTRAS
jgi:signal transduction histidine kinase